jgi:hypothetical protein
MLFTIDLLKGQGKPKLKPKGTLLLVAAALILPFLVFLIMTGKYVSAQIDVPIKTKTLEKAKQAGDGQLKMYDTQIEKCKKYLAEVSVALKSQVQWSDRLTGIIQNMPNSVILDKLDCKTVSYSQREQSKEDPQKTITVSGSRKVLSMIFFTEGDRSADSDMQEYVGKLTELGLNAIIKNQENVYVNEKKVKKYQVECILERN